MFRVPLILKPWNYDFQPRPPLNPQDPSPATLAAFLYIASLSTLFGLATSHSRVVWIGGLMAMTLIGSAVGGVAQPLLLKKTTPTVKVRVTSGAIAGLLLGFSALFFGQDNYKAGTATGCLFLIAAAICAVYTFSGRSTGEFIPLQHIEPAPENNATLTPAHVQPAPATG